MDNPGYLSLGDVPITTPVTGTAIGTGVTGLSGIQSARFSLKWAPVGTTGTSVDAYIQTRLGADTDWFDIARRTFLGTAETRLFAISQGTSIGTGIAPTDAGSLTDNTTVPLLGTEFRLKLGTSTGTFGAGSVLSGRMNAS